jgi:hypothetical protein
MHRIRTISTKALLALASVVLASPTPVAAQSRYLPEGASGFVAFAQYGSHEAIMALSGDLTYSLAGKLGVGLVVGTASVQDEMGFYTGEDPKLMYYGPRVSVHLAPPADSRSIGIVFGGGYEWQEFTHPDISATGGELTARGLIIDACLYRVLERSPTIDVYLDVTYRHNRSTVRGTTATTSDEVGNPTTSWGGGLALAFKRAIGNSTRAVVRPFVDITEGDLNFGISVGLVLPTSAGSGG